METLLIAVLISIILTVILAGRRSQPPTVIYLTPPVAPPQRAGMGCLPLIIGTFVCFILLRLLAG